MTKLLITLALATTAPFALAQNCFNAPAPGIALGNGQDVVLPMQPIGFPFPLAGSTFTDIHISDHGLAFLSNGGVPVPPASGSALLYTPSSATLTTGSPMLCALWGDIIADLTESQIYIDSSPAQCTVTWSSVHNFGFPSTYSMQMKLFPSGEIEFAWGVGATNNSTFAGASQTGVCGVTPGNGVLLPAPIDISAGALTSDNTAFEQWLTPQTFDMANTGVRLVPTNPGWVAIPLGGPTNCASASDYGSGCGGEHDSVYQPFVNTTFDLTGQTITYLRTASGYAVTSAVPGTFVAPSAAAMPVAPGQLDGQTQFALSAAMPIPGGTTISLNITTKGQVEVSGTPVGIDYSPTPAELLSWPNTAFHLWHDFDQTGTGSGLITFEESGGVAYATWNGVHSFNSPTPSTFQFQFDLATGNVTLVIVSAGGISDLSNPDACVVGYSVGGASMDPGATDLSALNGVINLGDIDGTPLTLTSTGGKPFVGNSTFGYSLRGVPALVPLGFLFFGDTAVDPGVDLSFLGMPGCSAHTNANLGAFTIPVASGIGTFTLPIANSVSLIGISVAAQGLAVSTATPAGLITSNGTLLVVGN